ncbi:hypothetical protein Clacol_004325 [Clathrus columnatus]|uniref:Uncharacterized protein n=1 Tax=Clathrus columnatus TaxID=1419009 RepID=A0AAV5AA47_9AGAM|nr:hypothetical protein Clacol_004325 [Clathrus columnatus]
MNNGTASTAQHRPESNCDILVSLYEYLGSISLAFNVGMIIWDVLAFLAVVRQVWGLWREKRRLHLQTSADVVTLLLQQVKLLERRLLGIVIPLFRMLSTILMCEFTLGLRRRNTGNAITNQSALELPSLSFQGNPVQSILGRLHESIVSDMGERTDSVTVNDGESEPEERDRGAA